MFTELDHTTSGCTAVADHTGGAAVPAADTARAAAAAAG